MPEKTPLHPVIHGKIDRDDYTIEKVFFASFPGHYVSGNLYRPKGKSGRLPGVLCPHGHWQNGRFYENSEEAAKRDIEIGEEKTRESARYPLQARCAMLARLGYVVFHYDMVGNADSQQIPHTEGFTDVEAVLRLQSFMGLQTWNSIRSLDFLTSLPDVDPKRIAVTGASGGGTQTFILDAVDDRPAVAFPAVMVSIAMQGGCVCENSPLLRVGTNNVEIAALFAPKPQGMTGANDWTKEIETKGLPELKTVYGLYNADDQVMAKYYSFEHNYNQVSRETMYNWLNRHLKLGHAEPIHEAPFTPVPPKELSVYDEEHPRPADATDASGLRRYLTEQSRKQISDLAKRPDEYRRVARTALRVMVNDSLPPKGEAAGFDGQKRREREGCLQEDGIIPAKGNRHAVAATRLTPPRWDGTVVIWVQPKGTAGLFDQDGQPLSAVRQLLDNGKAVLAPSLFLTGSESSPSSPTPMLRHLANEGSRYSGFTFGYNRSLLAERVHDLLTVIAAARDMQGVKQVQVVALEKAGPWAVLACALAGDAVDKSALDLNGFDFDQIKTADDEMMMPGALKYGGIFGFMPLISGETLFAHAPDQSQSRMLLKSDRQHSMETVTPAEAVQWLLGKELY